MSYLAKRLALLVAVVLLVACQRSAAVPTPTPGLGTGIPPTPTLEGEAGGGFGLPSLPDLVGGAGDATPTVGLAPVNPGFAGVFSNLRFSTSGNGEPQTTFPAGTQEIYALWDYDGMSVSDRMQRTWYRNEVQCVDRAETWDYNKYGTIGAVRDVYLYDYLDGIEQGQWRVDLYLNGELQVSGSFTVGDGVGQAGGECP